MAQRFNLGRIVSTPAALEALGKNFQTPSEFLSRHHQGDWGELEKDDKAANEIAVIDGSRILSSYLLRNGEKIWIITEADRSSTCVLLPEDY